MSGTTRRLGAALAAALAGATAVPAQAAAPAAPPASSRLIGKFTMRGRVTVASDVPGERAGQTVRRTWSFRSSCRAAQCPTATLTRRRANGTDTLTLRRRSGAYYVGSGRFYGPVRCGERTYRRGALVPFTIAVRITAAVPFGPLAQATKLRATYVNRSRTNLTPCVAALGHDSARYDGVLTGAA